MKNDIETITNMIQSMMQNQDSNFFILQMNKLAQQIDEAVDSDDVTILSEGIFSMVVIEMSKYLPHEITQNGAFTFSQDNRYDFYLKLSEANTELRQGILKSMAKTLRDNLGIFKEFLQRKETWFSDGDIQEHVNSIGCPLGSESKPSKYLTGETILTTNKDNVSLSEPSFFKNMNKE